MSEGQDQENQAGFVVKDRRRFDSEGNERAQVRVEPAVGGEKAASASSSASKPSKQPAMGEIDFSSFVMSLASQALWQLGIMPPPEGMHVPVDKDAARQTIEILGMLESKTSGNLDEVESRLIKDILHELRINYVKIA